MPLAFLASKNAATPTAEATVVSPSVAVVPVAQPEPVTESQVLNWLAGEVQSSDDLTVSAGSCDQRGNLDMYECVLAFAGTETRAKVSVTCLGTSRVEECRWWDYL